MALVTFMNSSAGRVTRGVAGVAALAGGAALGGWGWALAAVGLVLVVAGVGDFCPLAQLWGKPVSGKKFRASN